MPFDIDQLVADCQAALREAHPGPAVREILARAMEKPADVAAAFQPPTRAELTPLFSSAELTVLNIVWAPGMKVPPHDHLMWAAIGIYGGGENNQFFRRGPGGLVTSGQKSLEVRDTMSLGADVIHSVVNPSTVNFTGSIHVYGGDYLNKPRSVWNPDTMEEEPSTGEQIRSLFDAANEHLPQV